METIAIARFIAKNISNMLNIKQFNTEAIVCSADTIYYRIFQLQIA